MADGGGVWWWPAWWGFFFFEVGDFFVGEQTDDYSGEKKGPVVFDVGPSPLVWDPFLWAVDAIE